MIALLLTAFLLLQGHVLRWEAPTKNLNGYPLHDLAGFVVYRGETSRDYVHQLDVGRVLLLDLRQTDADPSVLYFYAVTAYDTAGNVSPPSNEVSNILAPTGLPGTVEPGEDLFVIYPNPFDAFITIETGDREGVVQVFNLLGRRVDLIYATRDGTTHDTSRLPSGVYLFQFRGQTIKGLLLR